MDVVPIYIAMVLSGIGFLASAAVHVSALLGVSLISDPGPLGFGGILVFVPAILLTNPMVAKRKPGEFWKIVLGGCPRWMQIFLRILLGYAILIFCLGFASGSHKHASGPFTIEEIRESTGPLLLLYGITFAICYSAAKTRK